MDKRILLSLALSTSVVVVGLSLPQSALAAGSTSLIDRIIEKFGLNKDQVQTVVNDYRIERQTQSKQVFEDRLNQAVQNGELTEEKKKLIVDKHTQLQQQREAQQEDLEKWAVDNGIDLKYFYGRGMGHGWKHR